MGLTRTKIDKDIKKFDPGEPYCGDGFWAYRFLLTALETGPDLKAIEEFWSRPKDEARFKIFYRRAVRNRIFIKGKLDAEIYSDGIGLALGSCILNGLIKRVKQTNRATPKGE
jgi:hypothetical protein